MADLIDRAASMKEICNSCNGWCDNTNCDCTACKSEHRCDIVCSISEAPTIEAKPVNPWVNVAHEKPPCRGHYFIAYKFQGSDMRFFGEAFWHDDIPTNGYVNGDHFSNEGVDGMHVTHWMGIPKLPNCGAKMDLED